MGTIEDEESQNREEPRPMISRPPSLSQTYPWLVIIDGNDNSRQTFYSISRNHFDIRHIPEMQNKIIVSSQNGWLFLQDNDTNDCSLFNRFTLDKIQLPQHRPPPHTPVQSSSCTKLDNSCRILVIRGNFHKFRSCYLGDIEFIKRKLSRDSQGYIGPVVNYEGKLYAVTTLFNYDLLVADFADPELHFTSLIRGDGSMNHILSISEDRKFYLIESNGELLFVYSNRLNHDGLDIKIFKADIDRKEWTVVEDLGDRALFLDDYKGLSSSTSLSGSGLKSNCVYYVHTYEARVLYVYDMKDGTVTMSLPCPEVSKQHSSLFWAM